MIADSKSSNPWLVIGAVSGLLAVALGAFGAHGLKDVLSAYGHEIYDKAVRYQMFHTTALLVVGILREVRPDKNVTPAGIAFLAGIVIFSGSLYLLALTGHKWLGAITPLGGIAFIAGWGWIASLFMRR